AGGLVTWQGVVGAPARAARQAAAVRPTEAVVVGPGKPGAPLPAARFAAGDRVTIRWTYPAGHPVTGRLDLPRAAAPGDQVAIWVTASGDLADPPAGRKELTVLAVATGTAVAVLPSGAVLAGYGLRRRTLARRADVLWDSGWAAVEPHWSGRLRGGI
ncbi:hypothetical protein, partial [Kitasatospora nipponensis]|uniref:hypothetical protein n=1 Tax=Kitasatospora nipponensis TaxID=258049 RepID=UPI0031D5E936